MHPHECGRERDREWDEHRDPRSNDFSTVRLDGFHVSESAHGQLAAGTYTVTLEIYNVSNQLTSTSTSSLTVIPATSRGSLLSIAPGVDPVRINAQSGLVQSLRWVGGAEPIRPLGPAVFDPARRDLFFVTHDIGQINPYWLRRIDHRGNAPSIRPVDSPLFLELDPGTGKLISAAAQPGMPITRFDPLAYETPEVIVTPGLNGITSAVATMDRDTRMLYVIASQQLVTVDLATKSFTTRPLSSPEILFVEFDPLSHSLIAATSGAGVPLVRIDPASGSTTPILTTGAAGAVRASSTFDPRRRELYFLSGTSQVVTVSLGTQTVTTTPLSTAAAYSFLELDSHGIPDAPISAPALAALIAALAIAAVLIVPR